MATRSHGLFRRIEQPGLHHAHESCFVTGQTGPGVDLGIDIEGYGGLFLSLNTVREIAEVAGFSVNEEGQHLEEVNAHLEHELAQARATISELEVELETVAKVVARAARPVAEGPAW